MSLKSILVFLTPFIVAMVLFVGIVTIALKLSRKGRHPIGKNIKLLRQPGEGLRERIGAIDEKFSEEIAYGLFVPTALFFAPLSTIQFPAVAAHFWTVFGHSLAACLISIGYRSIRVYRMIQERKNLRLGLAGERAVADALEELKLRGYHVYHDVPAQGPQNTFNLDHVVIGPTGIFAIETKARTKFAAKDGGDDHKVGFDGEVLKFPNGCEAEPVMQARWNARWLESEMQTRIGRSVAVTPLLAIPGWYTDETPHGGLRVLSHHRLAHYIERSGTLDPGTVNLVAKQLGVICRNVPCEG